MEEKKYLEGDLSKKVFCSCDTEIETELEIFANDKFKLFISIDDHSRSTNQFVVLNKETAIELFYTLKEEIDFLK